MAEKSAKAVSADTEFRKLHPPVIKAHIIDTREGISDHEGVIAVRIRSVDYNLLIMADYTPILGEIDGSTVILTEKGDISYEGIRGFFRHQNNEFTLLIEDRTESR